jgi:hypothetical protein
MDKKVKKVVGMIETYLREVSSLPEHGRPMPKEIEIHITNLLINNDLVDKAFAIEVIPIKISYIMRPRNQYTSTIMGGLPMFCKVCGRLLEPVRYKGMADNKFGYLPCSHEQSGQSN